MVDRILMEVISLYYSYVNEQRNLLCKGPASDRVLDFRKRARRAWQDNRFYRVMPQSAPEKWRVSLICHSGITTLTNWKLA